MPEGTKVTVPSILSRKGRGPRIVQLTAYDFPTAILADRAGADIIVVGDSLAQVALGYAETLQVDFAEMLHHVKAVTRARPRALVVADMPFLSYQCNTSEAIRNAGRFLKEGGASAVKMEGGLRTREVAAAIVDIGVPVMGHIGQTPQAIHKFGGFVVRGETATDADRIVEDALAFEQAGAFAVTLEMMPTALSERITNQLTIPTISSGGGPHCDGQVVIINDLLGFNFGPCHPKFVKEYAALGDLAVAALERFAREVRDGVYPGTEHSY